jgi:CRISPR-associated protein Cas1
MSVLKGRLGLETARVPHGDRHGLLWLRRGRLYVEDGTLRFLAAGDGDLEAGDYAIPYQMLNAILLEPGTTVTHDALRLLASHGTGLVAVAEGGVRFYASMPFGPDRSARARRQVTLWADPDKRTHVARRMYAFRLGEVLPNASIEVLRGIEGARVKESYRLAAQQFRVTWRGRRYDRENPDATDAPNQAINHAATAVCAAAEVAVAVAGAIPQLGFIHEDSGRSFALDIADLYREEVTLPGAFAGLQSFQANRNDTLERHVRRFVGQRIRTKKVVSSMIDRIKDLFDDHSGDP